MSKAISLSQSQWNKLYDRLKKEHPEYIVEYNIDDDLSGDVTDSSTRFGYYIMQAASMNDVVAYLPKTVNEIN